ncbi:hypothetical protein FZEAL_7612 [Fusarium zealandicum]|uniref:Gti1/Pac2 family protein n=1 Tax=Fusarium zealandicum TaxID=1053134 RepID=A0A8H4UG80_9HYPO|nr:hypothetical protein FZEAL_7612 [Fusarium zealandicum]
MSSPTNPLLPTFEGHIGSTVDALILFEACLSGQLNHVPRRPHDRERQDLIKSGNVFIYEEHASGIKRWTDGVSWSPSRILGNFLIYRELEKPFPPGEKKRALKKSKKIQQGISKPESSRPSNGMPFPSAMDPNANGKDAERALIGSLIDSYPFKPDGLVKKTISVTFQGVPHHLVSYYSVEDVLNGRLMTPTKHATLRTIIPRSELIMSQNFRAPIDEIECNNGDERLGHPLYSQIPQEYGGMAGSVLQRAMSLPSFTHVQLPGYHPGAPSPYGYPQHNHMPPPHLQHQQHHHHQQQQQQSYVATMPPNASPISYTAPAQNNYALESIRQPTRYGHSNGTGIEFPRNMPGASEARRHSNFDSGSSGELAGIPLGAIPESRAMTTAPYVQASSYQMAHRPAPMNGGVYGFSSPRQLKSESDDLGQHDDGSSQNYGIEDGGGPWTFDSMDNTPGHQTYYQGADGSTGGPQWPTGSNLDRS